MQELEYVSHSEASYVIRSTKFLATVDFQENDILEKTLHYIQQDHVIGQPMTRQAETKQNLKKAEFS